MKGHDTSMGGSRRDFPDTAWSVIISGTALDATQRQVQLNRLCACYWRPVYQYIRASWNHPVEDAKDLTQAFFCRLLSSEVLARFEPGQSRFRHYLKGVLRKFLSEARRDGARLKRGGGQPILSLNVAEVETERFLADLRQLTPEQLFDRQWGRDVIGQSIERLGRQLADEDKTRYMEVFEAYELNRTGSERPTYRRVADALGLTESDVKNYLVNVRARLRLLIFEHVADYVASEEEVAEELSELFA